MKALFQPEKLFKILMWCLALLFAYFLTCFGGLVIRDLPKAQSTISVEDYYSQDMLTLQNTQKELRKKIRNLSSDIQTLQLKKETSQTKYRIKKTNFDNWMNTRVTTKNTKLNVEVDKLVKELEVLLSNKDKTSQNLQAKKQNKLRTEQALEKSRINFDELKKESDKQYKKARFTLTFKVFLLRILFVLPILVFGFWLLIKHRQSKYWPFVWGCFFFALITFFFELVPYLPSYGGYVRSFVGLVCVVVGGFFGIQGMQNFLAARETKEKQAEEDRRKNLDVESAIKKINAKTCPSCERGLFDNDKQLNNFCVYCGLTIFTKCGKCGTRHNVFYLFCPECGLEKKDE